MTERSEIHTFEANDDAALTERINQSLNEVKAMLPENLRCMLMCTVTKDNEVKVSIIGSDMEIAKMLMTVTTVARNGVTQVNSPSNPSNEVLQ